MEARILAACSEALASGLAPRARILAAGSPAADRLEIQLEREGNRARLCCDLRSDRACIYLARPGASRDESESMRGLLAGRWIVGVDHPCPGPVLRLLLASSGEPEPSAWLVIEWLGGSPDIVLVDAAGREVLATLNQPGGSHASRRTRGADYQWPPAPHRPAYARATADQVRAALGDGRAPLRALVRGFADLSPTFAEEAIHRAGQDPEALAGVLREIAAAAFEPTLYGSFVSPIPLSSRGSGRGASGQSLLRMLEQAHEKAVRAEAEEGAAAEALRRIDGEIKRLKRLHDRLAHESGEAARGPAMRRMAETLLIHLNEIPRGASIFRVPDAHGGDAIIEIPLDPRLSVASNADLLFRRARRLERGEPLRRRRIVAVEQAVARLSTLRVRVAEEPRATDLGEERLAEALGPFARKRTSPPAAAPTQSRGPRSQRRPEPERFHPRTYKTREGWTVLVGRSNEENDHVTHRLARPEDYWFHAHGCPGSHVVLRREGRKDNPSVRTIEEAAAIAAYYSKARTSKKAPVIYTLKKYVRRPRKGPPGLALVTREKMVMVEPKAPAGADPIGWVDDEGED